MPADAEGKEESKSDQATTEMDSTSDVKEEGRKSQAGNDAVKDDEGEKTKDDDKSNGKESAGKADKETSGEDDNTELPGKEVDKKEDRDDATKMKEPAVKSDKEPSTETVAKEVIKEKVEGDVTKVKDQKDNGVKKEGVVGELPKTEGNDSEIKKDEVTEGKKRKSKFVETLAPIKREKRDRKSADAFKPDDFAKVDRSVNIADGRGVPLAKLDVCKNSIEKEPANSEVIALAHKLLFTVRGRPNKKDMKKNILMFSGFFSASKDPDKAKQEKLDLHEETKMCQKAYKLKIPELRMLCDLFGISRSEAKDKDGLVDALLDFLGEPCEKYLKGKRGIPSKKASRKLNKGKEDEEEEEDDDDENRDEDSDKEIEDSEEEVKKKKSIEKGSGTKKTTPAATSKGKMPSDSELREWVKAYVKCHHMGKSTIKQAIEIASEKFEIDITPAKRKIKDFLRDAL